jgi:diguanylate cyclase (GGDEF)-like protein
MTVVSQTALAFGRRIRPVAPASAGRRDADGELRYRLSWAAPAGAAFAALAATAGAAFRGRPTVFGALFLVAAVVIVPLLLRELVARILVRLDAEGADQETLRAELDAARKTREELHNLAYHDHLTGLPNRSLLYDRLGLAITHSLRQASQLALLFLDLDDFKTVNDSFGHGNGDRFLVELATRVRSSLRSGDTVARVGGDEFIVLLNNVSGREDATCVAVKVLAALGAPFRLDGHDVSIAASVGVSVYPGDGTSPEELVHSADAAMYRDKHRGARSGPGAIFRPVRAPRVSETRSSEVCHGAPPPISRVGRTPATRDDATKGIN